MNLLDHANIWVKGEVFQGKIMLVIGVILLLAAIAIFKSDNTLMRGTLIPMALILVILFGYGGFQTFSRPSHIDKVTMVYNKSPEKAIEQEFEKAQKDNKSYSNLKIVWVILLIVSAALYLVFSTDYLKGLSIGFIGLFLTTLVVDSILHQRLLVYYEFLKGVSQ